jgi:hypothetical protein
MRFFRKYAHTNERRPRLKNIFDKIAPHGLRARLRVIVVVLQSGESDSGLDRGPVKAAVTWRAASSFFAFETSDIIGD